MAPRKTTAALILAIFITAAFLFSGCLGGGDPEKKKPSVPGYYYDDDTLQADVRVPSEGAGGGTLAVKVLYPAREEDARFKDTGAPIVVYVPGTDIARSVFSGSQHFNRVLTGCGFVAVFFNFPGGGEKGNKSDGEYDSRGPSCQKALRDVLLYAQGELADENGFDITDVCRYADAGNVGILGWSNGGAVSAAVLNRYGAELSGVKYYVGYENPAGDEFYTRDTGTIARPNPGFVKRSTYLDPLLGSVSAINSTELWYDSISNNIYFDIDGNWKFDPNSDHVCKYWSYGGLRYYSTEIINACDDKLVMSFPAPGIADPEQTEDFWKERDMSRHFSGAVSNAEGLKGAMVFASAEDHSKTFADHEPDVMNYQGWSGLDFVRMNPDKSYVEHVYSLKGAQPGSEGPFRDNPANIEITLDNIHDHVQPEGEDPYHVAACILEMSDRVHYDKWDANLTGVILK